MTIDEIAGQVHHVLSGTRISLSDEKQAQAQMEAVLRAAMPADVTIEREPKLSAEDVPDFVVGGRLALEVKLRGANPTDVFRQLKRYASHAHIDGVMLATARAMGLPEEIDGKPVFYVSLGRAWI